MHPRPFRIFFDSIYWQKFKFLLDPQKLACGFFGKYLINSPFSHPKIKWAISEPNCVVECISCRGGGRVLGTWLWLVVISNIIFLVVVVIWYVMHELTIDQLGVEMLLSCCWFISSIKSRSDRAIDLSQITRETCFRSLSRSIARRGRSRMTMLMMTMKAEYYMHPRALQNSVATTQRTTSRGDWLCPGQKTATIIDNEWMAQQCHWLTTALVVWVKNRSNDYKWKRVKKIYW